jgi:hypothetical protein
MFKLEATWRVPERVSTLADFHFIFIIDLLTDNGVRVTSGLARGT